MRCYLLFQAFKDIPREKYHLATKVGRYKPEVDKMFDFSAERTIQSVNESLARMGVEYVDVIQVVWVFVSLPLLHYKLYQLISSTATHKEINGWQCLNISVYFCPWKWKSLNR